MTKNYLSLTKALIFVKECNIDFMWRSQFDATFLSGLWELWKNWKFPIKTIIQHNSDYFLIV